MFLNTLRIRQEIAERTGEGIKPELSAKLFVIEYTFPDFYKDLVKYRGQNFLCTLERLAKGDTDEKLNKEIEGSETLQKYYGIEDLRSLLKDEPFFCGRDIEPYIYLSGAKVPEEVLVFDESIVAELLSDDRVRMSLAANAIKKMPESEKRQYFHTVISKLKDEYIDGRWRAAIALGRIGDAEAVGPLIEALRDKNKMVRGAAAEALGKIGNAQAVEPLIAALKDKDEFSREMAAKALGDLDNSKAVDPLIEALKDKEANVRKSAVVSLEKIGAVKAVDPLIEALKAEDKFVRAYAAEALGAIGDIRAINPLNETLKDEIEAVRAMAKIAINKINVKQQALTVSKVI